jgi:hypothetical protein
LGPSLAARQSRLQRSASAPLGLASSPARQISGASLVFATKTLRAVCPSDTGPLPSVCQEETKGYGHPNTYRTLNSAHILRICRQTTTRTCIQQTYARTERERMGRRAEDRVGCRWLPRPETQSITHLVPFAVLTRFRPENHQVPPAKYCCIFSPRHHYLRCVRRGGNKTSNESGTCHQYLTSVS